ncbi:MAG: hypothetical protein QOH67_1520, partial [Hyphomicrobiales bacterium]|nr:hypothetical protein [Hyphomicrobiales bacterium]
MKLRNSSASRSSTSARVPVRNVNDEPCG